MPTDSIQLQIVKNGGAPSTSAVTAAFSDTILLKLASTSGVKKVKYRIYEFPDGFALPSGWTQEAPNCYSVTVAPGGDAPIFSLPASGNDLRGKYFFDAVVNDQKVNGSIVGGLKSKARLKIPMATAGLEDVGFLESNEFDELRQFTSALKAAIRVLDQAVLSGGGVSVHALLSGLTGDDHTQYEFARRPLTTPYTAASNDAALLDARKCIITTRATAISLRIRLQASIAWLSETLLGGINTGAGTLTITAEGGVTLNGSVTVPQNGWWWAKRTAFNIWQCFTGGTGGGGGSGDLKSDGSVGMAADFNLNTHKAIGMLPGAAGTDGVNKNQLDAVATAALQKDGSNAATGDLNLGAHKVTNSADGSSSTDLTTLQQVQALIAAAIGTAVDFKQSVRAATTSNIALSGTQSIDGVACVAPDRVLVKNQTTASQNGIYVVAAGAWPRATDSDVNAEVTSGLAVVVEEGTNNGQKLWILTTANPIVVGTTPLSFSAITGGGSAGNGLTGVGTLAVLPDGPSISVSGAGTKVSSGGITATELAAGAVTAAKLSALSITDIPAVDACATGNIALTGAQTPDGVTLASGASRVLVPFQTDPNENGVYVYNSGGAWTRATDFDAVPDFRLGVSFLIKSGTVYGGQLAAVATAPTTVGSSPISFLIGRTNNFGTEDIRTNAHVIAAATGTPTAVSDNGSQEACTTGSGIRGFVSRQASADANGADFVGTKTRGTHAAPSAHNADDVLAAFRARGRDASAEFDAGQMRWRAVSAGGTGKDSIFELVTHDGVAERIIQRVRSKRVQTTNATLTTAFSLALATDAMYSLGVRWSGKQSGNRAIKELTMIVRRVGSGDPTLVSSSTVTSLVKDDAAWGSDSEIGYALNTGTDAIDFTVKGKAATTIDWDVEVSWREL